MTSSLPEAVHGMLANGAELAVRPLPTRRVVHLEIRIFSGVVEEPSDRRGLTHLFAETLDKGTQRRGAQALLDAFDALGAGFQVDAGRETVTLSCTVLPEHLEPALDLIAEVVREPLFSEEAVAVAKELTRQEYLALEDDAQELSDKLLRERAMGPILGRHILGVPKEVQAAKRGDLLNYWRTFFVPGRMLAAVAGPITFEAAARLFEARFPAADPAAKTAAGRAAKKIEFKPGFFHFEKALEQQHIGLAFPGVGRLDPDYAIQKMAIGVLSGGMSSRLFTEVREKQGLVYWVGAWHDTPRGGGMIFLGASTTPARCDRTYETLLREIARLEEDVTAEELDRAATGMIAKLKTRGFSTRALCSELAEDLFHFGHPVPHREKIDHIRSVTVMDLGKFLQRHPRNSLCVVTVGPHPLSSGG